MKRRLKNLNIEYEWDYDGEKLMNLIEQVVMGLLEGEKVTVREMRTMNYLAYSCKKHAIKFESRSYSGNGEILVRRLSEDMWRLEELKITWDWKPEAFKVVFT